MSVWLVLRQAIVRQSWMQMHCRTPSGEKWTCQYFVRDRTTEGFHALRSSIAGELMQQGGNGGMFIIYWSYLLILGCFNLYIYCIYSIFRILTYLMIWCAMDVPGFDLQVCNIWMSVKATTGTWCSEKVMLFYPVQCAQSDLWHTAVAVP